MDFLEKKRNHVIKKRGNAVNNRYQNDDDDQDGEEYDHSSFIESMLNNINNDEK